MFRSALSHSHHQGLLIHARFRGFQYVFMLPATDMTFLACRTLRFALGAVETIDKKVAYHDGVFTEPQSFTVFYPPIALSSAFGVMGDIEF
jgi:hypothetical protein